MLPERVDSLVGSMLGKDYRVIQPIGAGGMAVVYLVEHQTLLKQFAAKVLSAELASSLEARARFTQEAHAASQLDHENIVSISDFGVTADHRPFFVMELLRGQTLDQRLADGPMSIEEVVAVAVPVARALAHAHAEGIVHRDVKPENVFLVQRRHGRWGVKVVDFGIAKTPLNPKLTKMGETLGSPLFMAPEMIRGDDDVDQRADVYSFGVVLYLMLCGQLPFGDDNLLKVMQMHLTAPVPPPSAVNPALPAELAAVVERALAKRVEDRYPSMAALLLDLEAALPPGADRLLIEAQSGIAVHDTPFAGALAIARPDVPRAVRLPLGESGQQTMRVPPLPSPVDEPRPVLPRSPAPRRIAIVASSAVVSGVLGILLWSQLAGHRAPPAPVVIAGPAPAAPAPAAPAPAAPAPAAAATLPPLDRGEPSGAAAGSAADPPAESPPRPAAAAESAAPAAIRPALAGKRPVIRPKPAPRREAIRPGARATAAGSAAGDAEVEGPRGGGTLAERTSISAAEPPPEPAPPPAAITAPVAPPAPAPPPERPPPVERPRAAAPIALDAVPSIASLDVTGSLAPSIVRRSVERLLGPLRACYRTAARAASATPAIDERREATGSNAPRVIDLALRFEIDENSLATHVTSQGDALGSLARCAIDAVGQLRTPQAPDVGTVQVSLVIRFRPT